MSIRKRIIYNVKYVFRLKFRETILTFLTKLVLEGKVSMFTTIKGNLILYCLKFLVFVVMVTI